MRTPDRVAPPPTASGARQGLWLVLLSVLLVLGLVVWSLHGILGTRVATASDVQEAMDPIGLHDIGHDYRIRGATRHASVFAATADRRKALRPAGVYGRAAHVACLWAGCPEAEEPVDRKEYVMLPEVRLGRHCCAPSTNPDNYRPLVGEALIDEIHTLAQALAGVRVCQINATAAGGGVAELLGRQIPLLRALGIEAEWRLIHGNPAFFALTKSFHNALQGAEIELTDTVRDTYLSRNHDCAAMLEETYDVYIVHDPQPAALCAFARSQQGRWIWRCHIDSSTPNAQVWGFLKPYVEAYDAAVFTLPEFCPPDLHGPRLVYIPPAIDPLSTKNMALPGDLPQRVLADAGVDLHRPLVLQVSRFDPWKDPLGVIRAYGLVKAQRPEVQLALVGAMAGDDPEGWAILETINAEAAHDTDIYVFTNLTGVGNMEVNAFQRGADVILQKSLKEGFGLVVSEALWKARSLVAGRAGGIPMQFLDAYQHYLVDSVEDCAARVLEPLDSVVVRERFGQAGREKVRQEFLLPRLVRDELRLIKELLGS